MQKITTLFLLIVLTLFAAACSPSFASAPEAVYEGDAGGGFDFGDDFAAEPGAPAEERAFADTGVVTSDSASAERLVIKNADLSIAVEDPLTNMDAIMKMAEAMGGFVVSSNLYYQTLESGAEVPRGEVMIRVPSTRFDEALTRIKEGVGRVLNESVSGQDVTQEYTDLQSRLRNLQAAETELQRIMEEAVKTEDVLSVYNQLIFIREQIEVIQGQINYFEEASALSAIRVSILADEAVQPLTIGSWEPVGVAKDAIQALINTSKFLAETLIWVVLYLLPVLLVLYVVVFLPGRAVLRRVFRRKPKPPADKPSE